MGKITQARVNEAMPQSKDYYIWDDKMTGFGCRIYPSGIKTYILKYTSPLNKSPQTIKIGRDGNIRDLKLVDGSLLLGQAAVKAVKQWRYKPYLRNGVAVEAETYVTVNFKLP